MFCISIFLPYSAKRTLIKTTCLSTFLFCTSRAEDLISTHPSDTNSSISVPSVGRALEATAPSFNSGASVGRQATHCLEDPVLPHSTLCSPRPALLGPHSTHVQRTGEQTGRRGPITQPSACKEPKSACRELWAQPHKHTTRAAEIPLPPSSIPASLQP